MEQLHLPVNNLMEQTDPPGRLDTFETESPIIDFGPLHSTTANNAEYLTGVIRETSSDISENEQENRISDTGSLTLDENNSGSEVSDHDAEYHVDYENLENQDPKEKHPIFVILGQLRQEGIIPSGKFFYTIISRVVKMTYPGCAKIL